MPLTSGALCMHKYKGKMQCFSLCSQMFSYISMCLKTKTPWRNWRFENDNAFKQRDKVVTICYCSDVVLQHMPGQLQNVYSGLFRWLHALSNFAIFNNLAVISRESTGQNKNTNDIKWLYIYYISTYILYISIRESWRNVQVLKNQEPCVLSCLGCMRPVLQLLGSFLKREVSGQQHYDFVYRYILVSSCKTMNQVSWWPAFCRIASSLSSDGAFFGPGEDILSEIWLGQATSLSVFLIKDLCLYHAFVNLWSSNPARILQLYIPAWYSRIMPSVTHYDVCKFNKPCASQQGSSQ